MVKKKSSKKSTENYVGIPTRSYLAYSPSLREIPDFEYTDLNRNYLPKNLPMVYDLENTDDRKFSRKSALNSAKIYGKYKAKGNQVIDLSGSPIGQSGVYQHKFYAVQFPEKILLRKTLQNNRKVGSQKRYTNLSRSDIAAIEQDMFFRDIQKMARHKRVTKGKKSYRS